MIWMAIIRCQYHPRNRPGKMQDSSMIMGTIMSMIMGTIMGMHMMIITIIRMSMKMMVTIITTIIMKSLLWIMVMVMLMVMLISTPLKISLVKKITYSPNSLAKSMILVARMLYFGNPWRATIWKVVSVSIIILWRRLRKNPRRK